MMERNIRCTKCNQTWGDSHKLTLPIDACTDGSLNHTSFSLCGVLSVGKGRRLECDLHEGHGTRHSGVDEKGIRWNWDAPAMDTKHVSAERVPAEKLAEGILSLGRASSSGVIPTVGRICHYTNLGDRDGKYPPEIQAALITKVVQRHVLVPSHLSVPPEAGYKISLHIFYEMGDFKMVDVPFTEEKAGSENARGKWSWPARV